jgi:hypothetical protein
MSGTGQWKAAASWLAKTSTLLPVADRPKPRVSFKR